MKLICLEFSDQKLNLTLRNTTTADAIFKAIPFESRIQTWGDEVDFNIQVTANLENDARDVVEAGEIAFWTKAAVLRLVLVQSLYHKVVKSVSPQ